MATMEEGKSPLRMFWVKLQRLRRGPAGRKIFIAIWVAIVLLVTILVYRYQASRQNNFVISSLRKKVIHYCNPPSPVVGREDQEPMEYAQFKLKQVQIAVRHGDRSSVSAELSSVITPHHFSCILNPRNSLHFKKITTLKNMVKVFKKRRVRSDGKVIVDDFTLHEGSPCKPGQLTSKGYLQHIYLGEYIHNAYGRKLGVSMGTVEEKQILTFATSIERTQQSAAAFLSGMLYPVFKQVNSTEKFPVVNIQISPDKLGFFREDENGEVPPCPKLFEILNKSKKSKSFQDGMAAIEPLMQTFSGLFNITRDKLPKLAWIGDLIATHSCHRHPPMCGPNGCINDNMKSKILVGSDWHFTAKYTPPATIIAHPTLSKVTQRMILKAGGEESSKFVLFFTHDSTIIPMLVELGIFQKEWVPYASRIVFELWEAAGLLATKLGGTELDKHFVRVLYNGRDYTRKISVCKDSLKFDKLCSLRSFVKYLEAGAENMRERFSSLCQSKEVNEEVRSL